MIQKLLDFFSVFLLSRILVSLALFAGISEANHSSMIDERSSSINRVDLIRQQLLEQDRENQQYGQQPEFKLTWYNWANWPNWPNWGNWGNWPNWPNY